MATLREIKKVFFTLSPKEQEQIIKEVYGFSKDMKSFLDMRLLGDGEEEYIKAITKVTESQTPKGYPKDIEVHKVNAVLTKAKKSKVSQKTLCKMEWIAFDGYMTYLNDYGGGPEIYEDKVYDHLNNYLHFLIESNPTQEQIQKVRNYLRTHTNMYYDHIWELFTKIIGVAV